MQQVAGPGNILDVVIAAFLSKIESDGQLPSEVVSELRRLASEGTLSSQENVEAALATGVSSHEPEEP